MGIAKAGDVKCEEDINNLIHQADELLYKVKTREKGNYAFWDYVFIFFGDVKSCVIFYRISDYIFVAGKGIICRVKITFGKKLIF